MRPEDEVDDEERDHLVDRVGDEALAEDGLLEVGARLAEGGDDEVGAGAGHAAEDAGRDGRAMTAAVMPVTTPATTT